MSQLWLGLVSGNCGVFCTLYHKQKVPFTCRAAPRTCTQAPTHTHTCTDTRIHSPCHDVSLPYILAGGAHGLGILVTDHFTPCYKLSVTPACCPGADLSAAPPVSHASLTADEAKALEVVVVDEYEIGVDEDELDDNAAPPPPPPPAASQAPPDHASLQAQALAQVGHGEPGLGV